MTYDQAIAVLAKLPLMRAVNAEDTDSYATVMEAWMHSKPKSELARAVEHFEGVAGAADALAKHAPYWEKQRVVRAVLDEYYANAR